MGSPCRPLTTAHCDPASARAEDGRSPGGQAAALPLFAELGDGVQASLAQDDIQRTLPRQPRVAPEPATFDEAFREIGRRTVGGGPKVTGADEITFIGNLGRGPVFLISRVRLNDPHESFYTCAPHRLRASKVGEAGHWVEIRVLGDCTDEDLTLIERLAQAVDSRRVEVRRSATGLRRDGGGR